MQTRSTLSRSAKTATAFKPTLSSVFKHTKARTTRRVVGKAVAVKTAQDQVEHTTVKSLSVFSDASTTYVASLTTEKTEKTRAEKKAVSSVKNPTKEPTAATPKVPEVNPWTKRPVHTPSYAKEALEHLCSVDPELALLVAKYPYQVYTDHDTNYFRVLSRTILGQQIHWKAARSIIFKFVSFYFQDKVTLESLDAGDKTFPTPAQVLATPLDALRQCGLSERKASYVQDLARHFAEGKITFTDRAMLQSMSDEEVASQLLCVRGIGPWTVDMFMMDSLERLDVLPTLDLGVRRGMEKHFKKRYKNGVWGTIVETQEETAVDIDIEAGQVEVSKKTVVKKSSAKGKGKAKNGEMSCEDMERMAERWRPYRSIASWYMWRNADENITAPF
ncbi:hypothetical protein EDD11_008393 [Mortierella claussenii]|nr:hypothetical protein EDD11_008393 [Mortierella claussenii]